MKRIAIQASTGIAWDIVEEGNFQGKTFYTVINPSTLQRETFWENEVTIAYRDATAPAWPRVK